MYAHMHTHSHLAKVCEIAKDLCKECEEVAGSSNSQVTVSLSESPHYATWNTCTCTHILAESRRVPPYTCM